MLPDWISPWWQAACLPRRWNVAGVSVPSLSVWHTFALENIGNPYLCGGPADRDDAAALLLFARHDRIGGLRLLHDARYRTRAMRRMFWALRRVPFGEIDGACQQYVETCTRAPRRWRKDGESAGSCAVPYQLHILRAACADFRIPVAGAWDMPYAEARMYYDAHAESQGDTSLMKPEHEALDDEMVANQHAELASKAGLN
jgi:hypothetical protein